MNVRAKFVCNAKEETLSGKDRLTTVKLSPVYSDKDGSENRQFWKWTPSGMIELGCISNSAADAFTLGSEYYVDFTPAPADSR